MSRKEWPRENVEKLINMYEENPILWDTKCTEYRNREKKQKILQDFATEFDCALEEVQRKLHNLRNQMSQELKKMKKKKSLAGTDEIYVSNWLYFSALKFLLPALTANQSQSSMQSFSQTTESLEVNSQSEGQVSEAVSSDVEDNEETRNDQASTNKRKRKCKDNTSDTDEKLFKSALATLQKPLDDDDRFGQYVALELRGLRTDFYKRKLKSEIRKAVVRICDEEEMHYASTSSSVSTPLQAPGILEPFVELHTEQESSSSCA